MNRDFESAEWATYHQASSRWIGSLIHKLHLRFQPKTSPARLQSAAPDCPGPVR